MAVTQQRKNLLDFQREKTRKKKLKEKKVIKKIREALMRMNNINYYDHFEDTTSMTYQNLLTFLTLIEKQCEEVYGEKKKYKKKEVESILCDVFDSPTQRQASTLDEIHKVVKKSKNTNIRAFKFKGLRKSDTFHKYVRDDDDYELGFEMNAN